MSTEDDDGGDTASEMTSAVSERTNYSVATDTSTTLSVQEALNSKYFYYKQTLDQFLSKSWNMLGK